MRVPRGLDRNSFQVVEGWPYVQGLIFDVLGTRVGTRVLRRGYGGDAPAFVDAPGNAATLLRLIAQAAVAIDQLRDLSTGEAIVRLQRGIKVAAARDGKYSLQIAVRTLWDGEDRTLDLGVLA